MKYLRYKGEFLSRAGVIWRAEILQEAQAAFSQVGALEFDADGALVIEWKREDKENVICGSTATLQIISPGDRTYEDLYTIEPGSIRLDVYKNNALYWSGCLDPEFYEEPYERASQYNVSLIFSDFGILDRIKYDLTGMRTLREIVTYALQRMGILYTLDTSMISTAFSDGSSIAGGGLSVRSDNFIDEDGEPSTMHEALEGILQPLALRIVQRAGVVYVYDLNGLYSKGTAKEIEWDGDSQTMGTDKVVNNAVVFFSPYSSAELLNGEVEYGGKYDVEHTNTQESMDYGSEYGAYYSFNPDYDPGLRTDFDIDPIDFTIFLHQKGKGVDIKQIGLHFFHILPVQGSGEECSGIAYAVRAGCDAIAGKYTRWVPQLFQGIGKPKGNTLFTTERVFLPSIPAVDRYKYKVRLMLEIMLDARYNPFYDSGDYNEGGNDNMLKTRSGFVFIPAKVTLYDESGKAIYHYKNKGTAESAAVGFLGGTRAGTGTWVAGADPGGDFWLEYYNPEDLQEDAGIRGWKGNRHCIGRPDGAGGRMRPKMYSAFISMDDGEYMPYPPAAGYLEIEILSGVYGYDFGDSCAFGSSDSQWDKSDIYGKLRWLLYKAPVVDVVNNNLVFDAAELEDVEYSGYINKSAKEEMSIETICGTSVKTCPTARGIYYRTSSGEQLQMLTRAGRTDHPEKLLIGTLCSQYADRKVTLSGEARIEGGLPYFTEQNQGAKRFMLMSDVQNIIMDTTDAEYCEFRPDEYDGIEEVED